MQETLPCTTEGVCPGVLQMFLIMIIVQYLIPDSVTSELVVLF